MCLKEKVLGGRASFSGVYFATPKFVVACRESGDAFELVRYENSLCMYPEAKIPVVRSIHRLLFMFQLFLINRRIKTILFIAALFAVASDVHAIKNPGLYDASLLPWDMLLYIAAAAVIFAAVTNRLRTAWKNTKKLLQYHGAEHKVINAIQHHEEPTEENVARQSRASPRCGTTLIVFYIPALIGINYLFGMSTFIGIFLAVIISIELFLIAQSSRFGRIFYPVVWVSQAIQLLLTTREPDYRQIRAAVKTMEHLQRELQA